MSETAPRPQTDQESNTGQADPHFSFDPEMVPGPRRRITPAVAALMPVVELEDIAQTPDGEPLL